MMHTPSHQVFYKDDLEAGEYKWHWNKSIYILLSNTPIKKREVMGFKRVTESKRRAHQPQLCLVGSEV